MRLLFLSMVCPLPVNNGHKMRTWALLRALAAEGHELSLLGLAQAEDLARPMGELESLCQTVEFLPMEDVSLSSAGNYMGRARALLSKTPYAIGRFTSPAMKSLVADQLASHAFDAIVCDTVYSAINLPDYAPLPLVMNTHNVEHLILERYAENEGNPFKRSYAMREAHVVKLWEQEICSRASLALACSASDAQRLEELCPKSLVSVAPNTIDVDFYVPASSSDELTVLFQGGMDWFPNRDAVSFFVNQVMPVLRRRIPGVRFVVAGRNPSKSFLQEFAGQSDVAFTGTVADMREVVAKASVCVVPLRIGSGTRLKILEAAAMGKPIVSTRLGAEGLEFRHGYEILLADKPEEFAAQVAELLQAPETRERLGLAARSLVERQYSFAVLRAAVRDALAQIPESHPALTVQ